MSAWNKVKDKLKGRDLDAEFEKFLNESLSEDSSVPTSPRGKTLGKTKGKSFPGSKPWWAEDDDLKEPSVKDVVRKSWIKAKGSTKDTLRSVEDDILEEDEADGTLLTQKDAVDSSKDVTSSVPPISISKDSLEEGTLPETKQEKSEMERSLPHSEDFQGSLTFTDETETGEKYSSPLGRTDTRTSSSVPPPGLDTLDEMKEKEQFFQELEGNATNTIDFQKLNKLLGDDSTLRPENEALQATGVEIRDSILKPDEDEDIKDSASDDRMESAESNNKEEETRDTQSEVTVQERPASRPEPKNKAIEDKLVEQCTTGGMLGKVALMESLESTAGLRDALQRYKDREKGGQRRSVLSPTHERGTSSEKTEDISGPSEKKEPHQDKASDETLQGTSATTAEIAELQKALLEARALSSQTLDMRIQKDVSREQGTRADNEMSHRFTAVKPSGVMILEKSETGRDNQANFDVRPTISDVSKEPKSTEIPNEILYDGSTGFALQPQPHLDSTDITLPATGFQSYDDSEKNELLRTLDKGHRESQSADFLATIDTQSRGFGLQPIRSLQSVDQGGPSTDFKSTEYDEPRGFDLQPVKNIISDDGDSSPPSESLKSIKEIAEARKESLRAKSQSSSRNIGTSSVKTKKPKSANTPVVKTSEQSDRKSSKKLTTTPKQSTPKSRPSSAVDHKKSWKRSRPPPSSQPMWSPMGTMKQPKKLQELVNYYENGKVAASKSRGSYTETIPDDTAVGQIAASVESFANYLKAFTRPEATRKSQEHQAKWSASEPILSRSTTIETRESLKSKLSSLEREKSLQREVQELRLALDDERKRNDSFMLELANREREFAKRDEKLRLQHDGRIHELQQEIFILQGKLDVKEDELRNKKDIGKKSLEDINPEDLNILRREISEQERLLNGYQQENERLYQELKRKDAQNKTLEAKLFSENQKLASELASVKEELELCGGARNISPRGSFTLAASKINQLENQIKFYKGREKDFQQEIKNLEDENENLRMRIKVLERQKRAINSPATAGNIEDMKRKHNFEIERLEKKIKWYAENQELLDRDATELRKAKEEIRELRDIIERLEKSEKKLKSDRDNKSKEKTSDAKRIQDLEIQVKEMEEIIKRRYPNSLPALIYASASAPGDTRVYEPPEKSTADQFLEKRIKKLEQELEEKDAETARKIRTVEQRYNAMSLQYEEHIRSLENNLSDANRKYKSRQSPGHMLDLERELGDVLEQSGKKIAELESEIKFLSGELQSARTQNKQNKNKQVTAREVKYSKRQTRVDLDQNTDPKIIHLKNMLDDKDKEVSNLKKTVDILQKERENMLVNQNAIFHNESSTFRSPRKSNNLTDRAVSPIFTEDYSERYFELKEFNERLKQQSEELQLNFEEQRLRHEAKVAKTEAEARRNREEASENLQKLKDQYEKELNKLKTEFAFSHSDSKIAELSNKLASQEIIIDHYKDRISEAVVDKELLAASKV